MRVFTSSLLLPLFLAGICLGCSSSDGGGSGNGGSGANATSGGASNTSGGASSAGTGQGGANVNGGANASGGSTTNGGANTGSGGDSGGTSSQAGASSGGDGSLPTIGGCNIFPAEDPWNTDISGEPADADWTTKLQNLAGDINLHPDYGNDGADVYGIPINVVPEDQAPVSIMFDEDGESDAGPYPIPDVGVVKVEGFSPEACNSDCHILTLVQGSCELYEAYACEWQGSYWQCYSGAKFNLNEVSYGQRPLGWTSADAAGLAITPGILRYDEFAAAAIHHALRMTVSCTRDNWVAPASHRAVPNDCTPDDPNAPPMGLRVRLKADYDTSGFSEEVQAVLEAMKKYGMIIADNGSNFYFQGESNENWTNESIDELKSVPVGEFEAITPPPLEP